MSTVRVIGSALKRAALYVPRKIAAEYRAQRAHQWGTLMKPSITPQSLAALDQRFYFGIEDEQKGPFVATAIKSLTEDAQGAKEKGLYPSKIAQMDRALATLGAAPPNAYVPIRDAEQVDLSAVDFLAKGAVHIEDEGIGPFKSTVLGPIANRTIRWTNIISRLSIISNYLYYFLAGI